MQYKQILHLLIAIGSLKKHISGNLFDKSLYQTTTHVRS